MIIFFFIKEILDIKIEEELIMERRPRRTHKELTEVLFDSVARMLSDQKFREIGINDLADFAKIEKNFIYKHYGDIDGVLREYVNRNDYWGKTGLAPETLEHITPKELFNVLLNGLYQGFSESIDFQNIIRWEIASSNEYVRQNARDREIEATPLTLFANQYMRLHPDKDIPCLFAMMSASIYYLILHKNISTFVGLDFSEKNQADRMLGVINNIAEYYFEDHVKTKNVISRLLERNIPVDEIATILDMSKEKVELLISSIDNK